MRFGLIPVTAGEVIIGPVIGVAVFDGVLHILGKGHWIVRMPAVADVSSTNTLLAQNVRSSVVQMGKGSGSGDPAEIPGSTEIVFRTCPNDNRPAFIIDENHVVPFTRPVILVLPDSQCHSHEMASSAGLSIEVVMLPVHILEVIGLAILLPILICPNIGGGLVIPSMQIQNVFRQCGETLKVSIGIESTHTL